MNRRSMLMTLGVFGTTTMAGCLSPGTSNQESVSAVTDVSTHRPPPGGPNKYVSSSHTDDPPEEPLPVDEFEPAIQRELVLAVTRGDYWGSGDSEFALDPTEMKSQVIKYGGEAFQIYLPVSSHGPDEAELYNPFELSTTIDGKELAVEITNTSTEEYGLHHYGRPYTGIMVAWDGEPHTLTNDNYSENDAIITAENNAVLDNHRNHEGIPGILEVSAGDTVEETYGLPNGIKNGATIWMDAHYRGKPQGGRDRARFQSYVWDLTLG